MEQYEKAMDEFIQAMKNSRVYREYREQEERLAMNPELMDRVRRFRGGVFEMQKNSDNAEVLSLAEEIRKENIELRRIPEVNAYLDAELALCKMIQKTMRRIIGSIEFDVPTM